MNAPETEDPKLIWATALPTGEIAINDGKKYEKFDRRTMTKITREGILGEVIENLVVTHHGDLLKLNDKGELKMAPSLYSVPSLDFRGSNQRGYELLVLEGEPRIVQITTPEKIVPLSVDIDNGAAASDWAVKMVSGQPTSNTFYDLIYAFFEKYDFYATKSGSTGHDHYVTFVDNKILIEGLNDAELKVLQDLLKSFFNLEPSPVKSPLRQFNLMQPPKPTSPQRKSLSTIFVEEEDEVVETQEMIY